MNRIGRRERVARKRQKRGLLWTSGMSSASEWLKLGHKHMVRHLRQSLRIPVADSETPEEIGRNEFGTKPSPRK